MYYITRGLVETLLGLGQESDPDPTTVPLAVTSADELRGTDLSPETPVFTHFYLPNKGDALNAVFGVDLTTPAGQTPGVFVSHPRGDLRVSKRDDLREVVFVGVPPWDESALDAFDRHGTKVKFRILEATPPEETVE